MWLIVAVAVLGIGWLPRAAAAVGLGGRRLLRGRRALRRLVRPARMAPTRLARSRTRRKRRWSTLTATPLLILGAVAVVLAVTGYAGLRRRDLGY